jgi:hypothetical protein
MRALALLRMYAEAWICVCRCSDVRRSLALPHPASLRHPHRQPRNGLRSGNDDLALARMAFVRGCGGNGARVAESQSARVSQAPRVDLMGWREMV